MVRDLKGRGASSFILYLFRPLRHLFSRFSLIFFIVLSLVFVFLSKTNPSFTDKISTSVSDFSSTITGWVLVPIDALGDVTKDAEKYMFVYGKNEELRLENRKLENRLSLLSQVELENRRLRQLLNFVKEPDYNYISARVVGDTTSAFIRTVLVNAGKWTNVRSGQAVIDDHGLVGRIIDVGERSSRVLLLSDINSRVPVITVESGIRSIMAGNNKEHPELSYLTEENRIITGEEVVTSGDGELFPPGIKIGRVYRSPSDDKFYVEPFAKWSKLQFISIINYHYSQPVGVDEDDTPVTAP